MSGRNALAFEEALIALDGFKTLPENWDDEGAHGVSSDVCMRAAHFLKRAQSQSSTGAPDVFATPEGGIKLIWRVNLPPGPGRVELHVLDKGTEFLVRVQGQRRHVEDGQLSDGVAEKVLLHYLQSATA